MNLLDCNVLCETFYCELFNLVFDYKFVNTNNNISNYESIDLIDDENKIVAQISSRKDKSKINDSLSKDIIKTHSDYRYLYICLINTNGLLRKRDDYENPYGIAFDSSKDCYDVKDIISEIMNLDIDKLSKLYELVKNELIVADDTKLYSDLAAIVKIINTKRLYKHDNMIRNPFEINKKIDHNDLNDYHSYIYDYSLYYQKLNEIYQSHQEANEDAEDNILATIRDFYLENKAQCKSSVELFEKIKEEVSTFVRESSNFDAQEIKKESLRRCVAIIVVDAFIKCRIFEDPEGYSYVPFR